MNNSNSSHKSTPCPLCGGESQAMSPDNNLALACIDCNLHKGTNVAGYDPDTGLLTELFHPRRQSWDEHFERQDAVIVGKTPIGRTTEVLQFNYEERLQLRTASGQ